MMTFSERLLKVKSENEVYKKMVADEEANIERYTHRKESLDELLLIVQKSARRTQDKLKERFEAIVQSCIDVVFPDTYTFHFDFVPRRNKTEVDIYLTDSTETKLDPMESNGGGVVDVISMALRVACLTISGKDKVLLLDEPTAHLRGEAKLKLGEVLKSISEKIGLQIIMVNDTSGNTIRPDREFLVTKNNNVSHVKQKERENYDYS